MAYVPPARRGHTQQPSNDESSDVTGGASEQLKEKLCDLTLTKPTTNPTALFADDIHDYYWAPQSNQNDDEGSPAAFTAGVSHSTLNSSALNRDKLTYVMLFKDANPRWASDGIIFVKSSLQLLPGGEKYKDVGASGVVFTQPGLPKIIAGTHIAIQEQDTIGGSGDSVKQIPNEQQAADENWRVDEQRNTQDREAAKPLGQIAEEHDSVAALAQGGPHSNPAVYHSQQDTDTDVAPKLVSDENSEAATKTSYTPDLSQYDTGPVAIFEQVAQRQTGPFRFTGYHKITRLQYLAPRSAELCRMLAQKFSTIDRFGRVRKQRERTPASWHASMCLTWAVIKMEQDEEANASLPPPQVTSRIP